MRDYAYVEYLKDMGTVEVGKDGELYQFNMPSHKGQVDLVQVNEYEFLTEAFPDSIRGEKINKNDLLNKIGSLYERLNEEYNSLGIENSYVKSKLSEFKDVYDSIHETSSFVSNLPSSAEMLGHRVSDGDIDEVAGRYATVQYEVRKLQNRTDIKTNERSM